MRLHNGKLAFQDQHLGRLYENLKAVDIDIDMSQDALTAEIMRTCNANDMTDDVHIRLIVSRGLKKPPISIRMPMLAVRRLSSFRSTRRHGRSNPSASSPCMCIVAHQTPRIQNGTACPS